MSRDQQQQQQHQQQQQQYYHLQQQQHQQQQQQQQFQQQQQTQPPVVVVQQPVVVNDARSKNYPFVLRGARFSNGCRFPGQLFFAMTTLGFGSVFTGIVSLYFNALNMTGALFTVFGLTLFIPGLLLCITAKRQYDELPADHPHRLKYGTGFRIPVNTFNNTTTYAFPAASVTAPGGQTVGYPVMVTAGQASSYTVQTGGQTTTYPYTAEGHSNGTGMRHYPTGGRRSPVPPPGHSSNMPPTTPPPQYSSYDPPPPYSEISKDTSFKPPV